MGVGLSGGEEGARRGPSIMPGGPREAYDRVAPVFEAIAAHFGSDACVTYLGPHSAGHYVKMVHNGIEYGLMALIAETYDLMKRSLGFSDDQLHDVYAEWNKEKLQSFLIEITSIIFQQVDEETGQRMIDLILDKADQMGTGMWTTESALELHVPAPTIDMGVEMRDLSVQKELREMESQMLAGPNPKYLGVPEVLVKQMENALHVGMILTYNQGLALLRKASEAYGYNFDLAEIIRIWRGGCIIRSALLNDILDAYRNNADLPDLLLDEEIGEIIQTKQKGLRAVVVAAAQTGIPAPGFMACLAYLDSCRSSWLPASLIQAQRDYFGAHAYHRVDMAGQFHTHWQE
jgi:6-phosphogluconate dehydrogenase